MARIAALALAAALLGYVGWLWWQVPDLEPLREGPAPVTSYMLLDAREPPGPPEYTPLDAMTPLLACAVVKAEDVRFFDHGGFDWPQIWHSVRHEGARRGASTLSQQLARNLYLSPERSWHRKLREAFVARGLESTLGKRRILELYLNVAEFGPGLWGVTAASRQYFEKSPDALDAFEASFLSARLPAPHAVLAGDNLDRVLRGQSRVLLSLYQSGLIDDATYGSAVARAEAAITSLRSGQPVKTALGAPPLSPVRAPPRRDDSPLAFEDALEAHCGHDREIAEGLP